MNEPYQQHVFYDVSGLSLETKREVLNLAKEHCHEWHVDVKEGWRRQPTDMSFEDILDKLGQSSHFVFIHRRGYMNSKLPGQWRIETGFSTMREPTYYLFIFMNESELKIFTDRFSLQPMTF